MKILHLLGDRVDLGGILSVVRNLDEATKHIALTHHAWVHESYVEGRRPPLSYRFSRHIRAESAHHLSIAVSALRGFAELRRLLRHEPFDVLHAHTRGTFLVALLAATSLRRPVLFTNHAYARRGGMYRRAARSANFYTVLLTPNMAMHYGLSEEPPRVNIISECCADRFFWEPPATPSPPARGNRVVRLAGVGNIVRWKKWDLLLEAIKLLPPADQQCLHFDHWGVAPPDSDSQGYANELMGLAARHPWENRICFHGHTNEIARCLRQSDWFVLPSTNEPCSVALIEAMALGLPAIASASGGNVDIIRDGGTGLLFEADNPSDLAEKLKAVLRGPMGVFNAAQIRESVKTRSASYVAKQYVPIYHRLAGDLQPGGREATPVLNRVSV